MVTQTRRHQVERFERFQRQFARARARRDFDEFQAALDDLVSRAVSPPPPPATSPVVSPPATTTQGRTVFDQQMRDLLVRVHGRPMPMSDPVEPTDTGDVWWSPKPVYGFRVWQLLGEQLHGAKKPWLSPQQTAVCLHRWTSDSPIPHDVNDCGRPPCGIYVVKNPDRIRDLVGPWFRQDPVTVFVGVAALSGRVIEHDTGYRAEHAEVVAGAVIDGTEHQVKTSWIDDPNDLTYLFASPNQLLARTLGGPTPTAMAFDIMFERLMVCAKRLAVA